MYGILKALFITIIVLVSFTAKMCFADVVPCQTNAVTLALSSSVTFTKDQPVGTESAEVGSTQQTVTCGPLSTTGRDFYFEYYANPATAVSGLKDVFPTNLTGTGIKYYVAIANYTGFSSCTQVSSEVPGNVPSYNGYSIAKCHYVGTTTGDTNVSVTIKTTAKLVKTSLDAVSGLISSVPSLKAEAVFNLENLQAVNGVNVTSASNVIAAMCNLNTTKLQIPLGDFSATEFSTQPGFTPVRTADGNLAMDCNSGTNISVTMTGNKNPDVSDNSVLALTGQGTSGVATGVGVQLLYNDKPLELDKLTSLKSSSGGTENFKFTARYYQTKASVMPGEANTSATLSLTYQ